MVTKWKPLEDGIESVTLLSWQSLDLDADQLWAIEFETSAGDRFWLEPGGPAWWAREATTVRVVGRRWVGAG